MVIMPGDRDDLLLATCMAAIGGTHVAAVLLTGGIKPDPRVWKLCDPALATGLPVLTIPYSTMQSVLYLPYINLEIRSTITTGCSGRWKRSPRTSPWNGRNRY